jgi:hypothetical protein
LISERGLNSLRGGELCQQSPLAWIVEETPSGGSARANWRAARQWRAAKRARREQDHLEHAARQGLIGWEELRSVPVERPDSAARSGMPMIDDASGKFCNQPAIRGRSWCKVHAARVFIGASEAGSEP